MTTYSQTQVNKIKTGMNEMRVNDRENRSKMNESYVCNLRRKVREGRLSVIEDRVE